MQVIKHIYYKKYTLLGVSKKGNIHVGYEKDEQGKDIKWVAVSCLPKKDQNILPYI